MIDLDWLDQQLEQALTDEVRCARQGLPAPTPPRPARARSASHGRRAPVAVVACSGEVRPEDEAQHLSAPAAGSLDVAGHARRIVELVRLGRLHEADPHIAAHAFLAGETGTPADQCDAAAWAAMRGLADGRESDARAAAGRVLALGREAGDPDAWNRHLIVRYRIVLEWGSEEERDELLEDCRARAYWFDEISWRGALTLLLARLGKFGEAAREFDITASRCLAAGTRPDGWLDVTTDLAEAAAVLEDPARASVAARTFEWPATGVAVAGRAEVCKGPVARYRALVAAATGDREQSDRHFRDATEAARRLGAPLVLARVLEEWGHSLAGRDDTRASAFLEESAQLARAG